MQKVKTRKAVSLKQGVLFLTAANLFVKLLGFVYKVPLNALIGDEMASVNAAMALFALLYTVSAGVPGALSLAIARARAARDGGRIRALLDTTLGIMMVVGLLLSLLVLFLAKPLAHWQGDGVGALCTVAVAPAVFFAAATGVLRGFFQGFSDLVPTAVSELLEAAGKTVFGIALAFLAIKTFEKDHATAAALAVFGVTLGLVLGSLYLAVRLRAQKERMLAHLPCERSDKTERSKAVRSVFLVAFPITLSATLMSLSSFIDAQLMRPLLSSFYGDEAIAKALYSDYSTGALTLFNLPSVFILPIATAIVPCVGGALAEGKRERAKAVTRTTLKVTSLLAFPAAFGLSAFSGPILSFVFHSDTDMAQNAGTLLSVLALSVVSSAFLTVSSALLQSFKGERKPMVALGIGICVKLLLISPLVRAFGALGVPLSTLAFYTVAALLNLIFLSRASEMRIPVADVFLRPLFCGALCVPLAYALYAPLSVKTSVALALLVAIAVAAFVYVFLVILFRAVDREELTLLPFGKRFAKKK